MMSYYLEHEGSEHVRVLRETLATWAKEDQDIYLVSKVGVKRTDINWQTKQTKQIYQKQQRAGAQLVGVNYC